MGLLIKIRKMKIKMNKKEINKNSSLRVLFKIS